MIRDVMAEVGFSFWGITSLLIFFILFVGILGWVFRKNSSRQYEDISRIPLEKSDSDIASDSRDS
ncbi:MAG: cbb3-type cytochrome c oxidase subunit 3 [SAR324 cluster bacterium]|nr:cbb3-type cytochrome c oxidase subunit 3 [SAR324 cluster bacterium]MBF0352961.1 cbb3-type cytochrome c oxidase subunit 3 [SAR324 cluster bacterium]